MKIIYTVLLILTAILPSWSQETEIRATIDKMFESMYKRDSASMRTCFTPDASLLTYHYDAKGNSKVSTEKLEDLLEGVASMQPLDMEERFTGWQCLIDDGMASVWTPYEFYVENKFSHCGVNSFQLMKVQEEWKITQISDTRRKSNCLTEDRSIAVIDSLMNQWHHAAAIADEDAFFGAMTEYGIYIGTDETERWLRDELKAWSKKYFDGEAAWNFKTLSRNINLAPGGQLAWFDELLDTWMGICRSTGILEKINGEWKIIHYHLSIAVPNDKLDGYRILIGKT